MTTPADRHLLAMHRSEVAVSVELQTPEMTLNIGPQHPSTHGVLRLVATISGERVENVQPVMGYMHRGYEKLAEVRTYAQITALVNRIDWVSGFANEVPFIVAAERLMGVEAPERAQYIRLVLTEMFRISNHLIFLCSFPAELGAPTPLMYALRERERVLDLIEGVTGGRFHPNFNRIGGVKPGGRGRVQAEDGVPGPAQGVHRRDPAGAWRRCGRCATTSRAWCWATRSSSSAPSASGSSPPRRAIEYGVSGPNLRASGVAFDLRKVEDYLPYHRFDFDVITMPNGDNYDRCRVRLEEIRQSARIIEQALDSLPAGPLQAKVPRVIKVPKGECYVRAENPKGEMGYHIVSGGGRRPVPGEDPLRLVLQPAGPALAAGGGADPRHHRHPGQPRLRARGRGPMSLLDNVWVVLALKLGVAVVVLFAVALVIMFAELKVSAHMQHRVGPYFAGGRWGWAQVFAEALKFLQKEDLVPRRGRRPGVPAGAHGVSAGHLRRDRHHPALPGAGGRRPRRGHLLRPGRRVGEHHRHPHGGLVVGEQVLPHRGPAGRRPVDRLRAAPGAGRGGGGHPGRDDVDGGHHRGPGPARRSTWAAWASACPTPCRGRSSASSSS